MKTLILPLLFLVNIYGTIAQTNFQKTYGGNGNDKRLFISPPSDNGFIISGLPQLIQPDFNNEEFNFLGLFKSETKAIQNNDYNKIFVYNNKLDTFFRVNFQTYRWDTISKIWKFSYRHSYLYDCINYRLKKEISQNSYGGTDSMINSFQHIYTYDEYGNQNGNINQSWDSYLNQWRDFNKLFWNYSSSGLLLDRTEFRWNSEIEKCILTTRTCYIYNETGEKTESFSYSFDSSGDTSLILKTEFYYNQMGQNDEWLSFTWDTIISNWINASRGFNIFDINGNYVTRTTQVWDTAATEWINSDEILYTYDENNNIKTHIYKVWNNESKKYDLYYIHEYFYDSNNNRIQSITEWGIEYGSLYFKIRSTYEYKNHYLIKSLGEVWDTTLNEWLTEYQYIYSYKDEINPPQVDIVNQQGENCLSTIHDSLIISSIGGTPPFFYLWDDRLIQSDSLAIGFEPDNYYHYQVTDSFCLISDSIYIFPFKDPEICMLTIDLNTGNNLIVWEKSENPEIDQFNIYRETSVQGDYEIIGSVSNDDLSIFRDSTADPESRQYLYKISIVDTCGNEILSPYHKPLFLQYVSSVGGVNLQWGEYEVENGSIGFKTYIIYRGTDSTALQEIVNISTSLDRYTDNDPAALKKRQYYRIAGEKLIPCYPTGSSDRKVDSGPYSQSMSNIEDNRLQVGMKKDFITNKFISIIPNPFSETTTLNFSNPEMNQYTLYIMDITGKFCRIVDNISTSQYVLEKGDLQAGLYILELRGPKVYRGKVVIE